MVRELDDRRFRNVVDHHAEDLIRIRDGEDPKQLLSRKTLTSLIWNGILTVIGSEVIIPERTLRCLGQIIYRRALIRDELV